MRLVIAECQVDYSGRLAAHLPKAKRLILIKADGSVAVHADDKAYKPLNWMSPPCSLTQQDPDPDDQLAGWSAVWRVASRGGDTLVIRLGETFLDTQHAFDPDPGLVKDGVEAHLQALLAEHPETVLPGCRLVQREFLTPLGPVDLLLRERGAGYVAVEVKRRGEIAGVEQLARYLETMNKDPRLAPVRGVLAAQQIKPQARTLASDRGIDCLLVDYDALRGIDDAEGRLF